MQAQSINLRQLDALKKLNDIAAISSMEPKETLRQALSVGRDFLALPFGIVSHIIDDSYYIRVQSSPPDTLADDMEFSLGVTYCSITLKAQDVIAIDDMGNSEYSKHPCFKTFNLATYIGAPIRVDGNIYGTINFSSPNKHAFGFDQADIEFVRLLARWAGAYLEKQASLEELQKLNEHLEKRVAIEVTTKIEIIKQREIERDALIQNEKMAQLGNMMGVLLHQWRQPLSTISLQTQAIQMENSDSTYIKDACACILEQVDFMVETANDFRDFYMPSKQKEKFNIYKQFHSVSSILSKQLSIGGIAIELVGDCDLYSYGYESEFKQVILNIINNAKDALLDKKPLNPLIKISIANENNITTITISDNAGGIPEELLPDKLFEPFVSTKGNSGTGVGLSLSRTIIQERMAGKLDASNNSAGAVFRIELQQH